MHIEFKEKDTLDLLRKISTNKVAGSDGFQSKLMKMCAKGLVRPLSLLSHKPFETGVVPKKWEMANEVPIVKKR